MIFRRIPIHIYDQSQRLDRAGVGTELYFEGNGPPTCGGVGVVGSVRRF